MPAHRLSLLVLAAYLCIPAAAADSPPDAPSDVPEPPALVTEGDPDRGITPCAECHQPNGGGSEAGAAARLAAIGEQYIVNQIENFRNGNRSHPVMTPWAKELTDAEVKALAAYYDALPPASNAIVPPNLKREDGQWLALYGDWPNRRLPACQQCHGPLGIGAGADFPALAGQPYNYLVKQMANWGTGDRVGDHDGMMRAVAEKLSMAEAQRVAAFYASLPAQKAVEVAAEIGSGERVPSAADLTPPGQSTAAPSPQDAAPKQHRWLAMPHLGGPSDIRDRRPPDATWRRAQPTSSRRRAPSARTTTSARWSPWASPSSAIPTATRCPASTSATPRSARAATWMPAGSRIRHRCGRRASTTPPIARRTTR
jgi:cytochrome c553